MTSRKVARESLEDAFSAPSGPGRRVSGPCEFPSAVTCAAPGPLLHLFAQPYRPRSRGTLHLRERTTRRTQSRRARQRNPEKL